MIDDPADAAGNPAGNPDPAEYAETSADRVIGDEPMTEGQAAYLRALCADTGAEFDPGLSQAAAAERIDQLKAVDPGLNAGADNHDMS